MWICPPPRAVGRNGRRRPQKAAEARPSTYPPKKTHQAAPAPSLLVLRHCSGKGAGGHRVRRHRHHRVNVLRQHRIEGNMGGRCDSTGRQPVQAAHHPTPTTYPPCFQSRPASAPAPTEAHANSARPKTPPCFPAPRQAITSVRRLIESSPRISNRAFPIFSGPQISRGKHKENSKRAKISEGKRK